MAASRWVWEALPYYPRLANLPTGPSYGFGQHSVIHRPGPVHRCKHARVSRIPTTNPSHCRPCTGFDLVSSSLAPVSQRCQTRWQKLFYIRKTLTVLTKAIAPCLVLLSYFRPSLAATLCLDLLSSTARLALALRLSDSYALGLPRLYDGGLDCHYLTFTARNSTSLRKDSYAVRSWIVIHSPTKDGTHPSLDAIKQTLQDYSCWSKPYSNSGREEAGVQAGFCTQKSVPALRLIIQCTTPAKLGLEPWPIFFGAPAKAPCHLASTSKLEKKKKSGHQFFQKGRR